MKDILVNIESIKECLATSISLIGSGKNEQVIRDSFTSFLLQIFPERPSWILRHIQGSETAVKVKKTDKIVTGFIDNLIDLTAIEYESDLTISSKYREGFDQVKEYCAGLVNEGNDPELIIGILSDTVRWFAYTINLEKLPEGQYTKDNIELIEIDAIDCNQVNDMTANMLANFLCRYLGRIGTRQITAYSISKDLGFESPFCQDNINSIRHVISDAFEHNPKYAEMIIGLWCNFVGYLREEGSSDRFDLGTYMDEFYIMTLGKLLCANFLEHKALISDRDELSSILDGTFFENKGLINFVEYDYFGWLNSEHYISSFIPIAAAIQEDLVAYNFSESPREDLFGQLMAQLANRSQRILLGQEWTPAWVSRTLVNHVADGIADDQHLQFIDMCCGSGSMLVEVVRTAKMRIERIEHEASQERKISCLVSSITGFDIDPLAVMLSKINWLLASLDWIEPLGIHTIAIPVYHADSLFALTPVSSSTNEKKEQIFSLKIAEYSIDLPEFLISPEYRRLFDSLIDTAYRVILETNGEQAFHISDDELIVYYNSLILSLDLRLNPEQKTSILSFMKELIEKIDALNRDGRNGIWSYILRNSFRPGLVAGQFNGLVSNPPWLALSKLANNPYQEILRKKATDFNIKPSGSSHLHIELATIFLLHAVKEYLIDNARIGCIVPETILNGHHHNPFRKFMFFQASVPISLKITELWRIPEYIFKNNAIILYGIKSSPNSDDDNPIPGFRLSENEQPKKLLYYRNVQGSRTAWTLTEPTGDTIGYFVPASFRQGADIMPRNLLFYDVKPTSDRNFVRITTINPITSELSFTVKDAKKHRDFSIKTRVLPKDLIFDIITSNLLTPFDVANFQKALLPIEKDGSNVWVELSKAALISKGPVALNTFKSICKLINPEDETTHSLFSSLNIRGKLSQQIIKSSGFIVLTGAGGGRVCSTYVDIRHIDVNRLIIDQTLYWAQVETEDEAIYLTGLFNSEALSSIIREFQPRGQYGERHIHKLPFGATPKYNPSEISHQSVVKITRELILEYQQTKYQNKKLMELLNPNNGMLSYRRRKLFEHIKTLKSYNDYEDACASLYGL